MPSNSNELPDRSHVVLPLGVFGVLASQDEFKQLRGEIVRLQGATSEDERADIARYLRSGAIVFAIMEYTRDVVSDAFGVSGGSAICTDGTFYWRLDSADYVERYRTGLPEEFMRHGRKLQWRAPTVSPEDVLSIDSYLLEHAVHLRVP